MDERTFALSRRLRDEMEREADLFARLCEEVDRLRDALRDKKWTAGLTVAQGMERFAAKIEEADSTRDEAFASLREEIGCPRETAFSAVLPLLPADWRGELEDSWRRLRTMVVRLKTLVGRLRYSAQSLAEVLNRVLEGAFPHRKGKIYSRRGTPTGVSGSLLVDQKL
jgi:hypothetical protein